MTLQYPVKKVYVTQPWGVNPRIYRKFGLKGHNGIDLRAFNPDGRRSFRGGKSEVFSPHHGKVIESRFDKGYGNYVKIENDNEGSILAHFSSLSPLKVGQTVKQGDFVGYQGSTGFSTGIHLHWGYYPKPRDKSNGYSGTVDQLKLPIKEMGESETMPDDKQKEIEDLKTQIAELTDKMESYKKQRDDARNDKKQLQLQINELKSNIQGCVNREDKLKTKMELMSGFEPGAKEFQKVIAGLEVKKTDGTDPTAQTVINSVTQKLTYRDDRIKELTEEITNLKEQKQKDPAGEAGKTAMRLSTPAIITFVATTIYQAYPVLGEMGVEIQAIAIFLTTLLTMVVDRWTHVSGKNNKLDGASHGLLKF